MDNQPILTDEERERLLAEDALRRNKRSRYYGRLTKTSSTYEKADIISSKTLGEIAAERMLRGEMGGQALRGALSQKIYARGKSIQKYFDPLNMLNKIPILGAALSASYGMKTGRSAADISYFTGAGRFIRQQPNIDNLVTNNYNETVSEKGKRTASPPAERTGSLATPVTNVKTPIGMLKKIFVLLKKWYDEDKKFREKMIRDAEIRDNFAEELAQEQKDKNEMLKALMAKHGFDFGKDKKPPKPDEPTWWDKFKEFFKNAILFSLPFFDSIRNIIQRLVNQMRRLLGLPPVENEQKPKTPPPEEEQKPKTPPPEEEQKPKPLPEEEQKPKGGKPGSRPTASNVPEKPKMTKSERAKLQTRIPKGKPGAGRFTQPPPAEEEIPKKPGLSPTKTPSGLPDLEKVRILGKVYSIIRSGKIGLGSILYSGSLNEGEEEALARERELLKLNQNMDETDRVAFAMNYFQSKAGLNLTEDQAAGLVGNLYYESGGLNPKIYGDGGLAYGLAQWHPARQKIFEQQYKKPIEQATFKEQLDYVAWELRNVPDYGLRELKQAKDSDTAAAIVGAQYEIPKSKDYTPRQEAARRILTKVRTSPPPSYQMNKPGMEDTTTVKPESGSFPSIFQSNARPILESDKLSSRMNASVNENMNLASVNKANAPVTVNTVNNNSGGNVIQSSGGGGNFLVRNDEPAFMRAQMNNTQIS